MCVQPHGVFKADRTGTGTTSVFGYQMRFDLNEGFPLVTTKKVHLKSIIHELLWFLTGSSNNWLRERGVTIWDEWARPDGDLGRCTACSGAAGPRPTAGTSTRFRGHQDPQGQPRLAPHHRQRLERGRAGPDGPDALPRLFPVLRGPGHIARRPGKLSCQLYQRSADIFLGVPFNIASYALLTHMVAQQCDLDVGDFIWTGGDCHIYSNHTEQVDCSSAATPRPYPTLTIKRNPDSIFDYQFEDFEVTDYQCHPAIKAPVAV
jgi:thymidylate synthase